MSKIKPRKHTVGTAYHEAGHAVVSLEVGRPVKSVELLDLDPDRLGVMTPYRSPAYWSGLVAGDVPDLWKVVPSVMISFAGQLAEKMRTGRFSRVGAGADDDWIFSLCGSAAGDHEEQRLMISWLAARTTGMLKTPMVWLKVRLVAAELLEHKKLDSKALRRLCRFPLDRGPDALAEAEADLAEIAKRDRMSKAGTAGRPGSPANRYLLAACEAALARIESDIETARQKTPEGEQLRAAIAKAKGRDS